MTHDLILTQYLFTNYLLVSHGHADVGETSVPETLSLVVQGSRVAACSSLIQLSQ